MIVVLAKKKKEAGKVSIVSQACDLLRKMCTHTRARNLECPGRCHRTSLEGGALRPSCGSCGARGNRLHVESLLPEHDWCAQLTHFYLLFYRLPFTAVCRGRLLPARPKLRARLPPPYAPDDVADTMHVEARRIRTLAGTVGPAVVVSGVNALLWP